MDICIVYTHIYEIHTHGIIQVYVELYGCCYYVSAYVYIYIIYMYICYILTPFPYSPYIIEYLLYLGTLLGTKNTKSETFPVPAFKKIIIC